MSSPGVIDGLYPILLTQDWQEEIEFYVGDEATVEDLSTLTNAVVTLVPARGSGLSTWSFSMVGGKIARSNNALSWVIDKTEVVANLQAGRWDFRVDLAWSDGLEQTVLRGQAVVS